MAYVEDVFDAAMGIMDELSADGEALTGDTEEYALRTPAILNSLVSELKILTGQRGDWLPVTSMEDVVPVADTSYAFGALPYGLAAGLLIDENPSAASFYQQRYEELRALFVSRLKASVEDIDMLYGGVGEGRFARW